MSKFTKYFHIPKPWKSETASREVTSRRDLDRIHKEGRSRVALDDSGSSISKMMRDKTMMKMIREDKSSDHGLRREAEAIERDNNNKRKQQWLENKKANLERMKRDFKIA